MITFRLYTRISASLKHGEKNLPNYEQLHGLLKSPGPNAGMYRDDQYILFVY